MAHEVPNAGYSDVGNTNVTINLEWLHLLVSIMDIYARVGNFLTLDDLAGWQGFIDYMSEAIDDEG